MNFDYLTTLFLTLLLSDLTHSLVLHEEKARNLPIRAVPNYLRAVSQLVPTAYTTSRSANTQFVAPQTVGSGNPDATTETTTHTANTQIIPSAGTGSSPPLITTDSRSANTQAVGPSTAPSTTLASGNHAPTLGVFREAALGAAVVVGFGMGFGA